MSTLEIKDLHVSIEGKEILKGINLVINDNEIHAIMGPNGNGKSTLLSTIMGHPSYEVTQGSIILDGEDVLEMEIDERSRAGLFLGMQYPQVVGGVTNSDFMKAAMNARRETPIGLFEFVKKLEGAIKELEMKSDLAHRYLNEGFSGGEKKRNEILQLILLEPTFAMLDEIDSGLDIDALKIVANVLQQQQKEKKMGLMIVSHYERFFEFITPTHTHILIDGRIVKSGGSELVTEIDQKGYDWLNVPKAFESKKTVSIGSCNVKKVLDNE